MFRRSLLASPLGSPLGLAAIPRGTKRGARLTPSIATITCDGFGDEDFRYAFETIPRLGLREIELNCWYSRNLTPAGIASIASRCRAAGLRPASLHVPALVGGDRHDVTRELGRLLWVMEAARRLGARLIKLTAAGRGQRGGLEGLIDVLAQLAPCAEALGLAIALENHLGSNLETPDDYDRVFAAITSPAIGMTLDPAHFCAARVDLPALVERFAPRVLHVDLKDNAAPGRHEAVPYGTGVVDLEDLVERLVRRGYHGYLVVELAKSQRGLVTEEQLRAGVELARRLRQRLG